MGSIAQTAPAYGRRLIPSTIDEIALNDPDRVYAAIPISNDLEKGFMNVTFRDFAKAIDRAAVWIEERFGRSKNFETLAYMGANDFRYYVMVVGACKVGFKTILPSPRNSLEGQLNLFAKTKCQALITSEGYLIPQNLLKETGLQPIYIPSISDFLAEGSVKHYPYTKSFDEGKLDPFFILHTSGSTGLPKPINCQQVWSTTLDAHHNMPLHKGHPSAFLNLENKRFFTSLPAFHAAGVMMGFVGPIYFDSTAYWAPTNRPVSTIVCEDVLSVADVDMAFLAPSTIEELVQSASGFAKLEKLDCLFFGGGPLSQGAGDLISKKTFLLSTMGSTECAGPPQYHMPDPEDWSYFCYSPALIGVQFRPYGDGSYELVFVRDKTTDPYHSTWHTFPEKEEYSMSDLYTPHPTKAGLWKYVGRADDVIVFSNGEKLNPTSTEATLRHHPSVKGALVVGQAKFSAAVIIELQDTAVAELKTAQQKAAFIEEHIWPLAQKANASAPSHAQLSQDKIIFSVEGKPFARAGKGTIQRVATVKSYKDEIEQIYSHEEEDQNQSGEVVKIDVTQDSESLENELGKLVEGVMKVEGLGREDDFFTKGMDSLMVMRTVRLLKLSLIGLPSEEGINTRLVYANPTFGLLAGAVKVLVSARNNANTKSREEIILETLDSFAAQFPTSTVPKVPTESPKSRPSSWIHRLFRSLGLTKSTESTNGKLAVLLTGSTGSLGSYLLSTLLSSPKIQKIYCLNRRPDAATAQQVSQNSKGLPSAFDPEKVQFLHADLSKPLLGLSAADYNTLKNEVTTIIHNQWQVDFNLALSSFHPHILGMVNMIHLSTSSSRRPEIHFTSSIGTLGNWPALHGTSIVPETKLEYPSITMQQGYSESKWISERLLQLASERLGVRGSVMRVGQIAGPAEIGVKGTWNKQEWLPTIIASSKYLGVVPGDLGGMGKVPWVPVDLLAGVIAELISTDTGRLEYYHLVNPRDGNWSDLVPVIISHFSTTKDLTDVKVVPFSDWVKKLEDSAAGTEGKEVDTTHNPAIKLLDFYRDMAAGGGEGEVVLETVKTMERSQRLRELRPVGGKWMGIWLGQWGF